MKAEIPKVICGGHMIYRCDWCKGCEPDTQNLSCPYYGEMHIYDFEVREGGLEKCAVCGESE